MGAPGSESSLAFSLCRPHECEDTLALTGGLEAVEPGTLAVCIVICSLRWCFMGSHSTRVQMGSGLDIV